MSIFVHKVIYCVKQWRIILKPINKLVDITLQSLKYLYNYVD